MCHSYCIHSSTDGHLGCFQILAIVNNVTVNIRVHIFFQISVSSFFGHNPRSGITGSKCISVFNFLRRLHTGLLAGQAVCQSNDQSHSFFFFSWCFWFLAFPFNFSYSFHFSNYTSHLLLHAVNFKKFGGDIG